MELWINARILAFRFRDFDLNNNLGGSNPTLNRAANLCNGRLNRIRPSQEGHRIEAGFAIAFERCYWLSFSYRLPWFGL
jgi:hypothetical protein